MADPVFDKEGNLVNLDELDRDEVAAAYQAKNHSLFGRLTEEEAKRKQYEADKAKLESELAEARKSATPSAPSPAVAPTKPDIDVDELRLIAKGLSDEEISEAKDIARGKGISITEALSTKSFTLFQENLREEKRKEDAKLSASKGSGSTPATEGIKAQMTPEEHKEAWKKAQGL